jgi:hypothetical protein
MTTYYDFTTRSTTVTATGVCWSPDLDLFVIVGSGTDDIATSPDGITWTGQGQYWSIPGGQGTAVVWSSSLALFVAVGTTYDGSESIYTSPDGATWTPRGNPWTPSTFVANDQCVAWDETAALFVAGANIEDGGPGAIATSPDGVTWTLQTTPFDDGLVQGVCYADGLSLWVAVGNNAAGTASLMTSPDAITWTTQTTPWDPGGAGNAVAWIPELSLLVAVAGGTAGPPFQFLITSSDGITWAYQTTPLDGTSYGYGTAIVDIGGEIMVAGGSNSSDASVILSTDATTWDANPSGEFFSSLAYSALRGVVVGVGDIVASGVPTTPPLPPATWAGQTTPFGDGGVVNGLCYSSEFTLFIAVGLSEDESVGIASSPNGVTWTPHENPWVEGGGNAVCFAPGLGIFVAVGYVASSGDPTIYTSPDGATWTEQGNPWNTGGSGEAVGLCVAWSEELGQFVAGGASSSGSHQNLFTSTDGMTWTHRSSVFDVSSRSISSVAWSPEQSLWLAVAWDASLDGGASAKSTDGVTWTSVTYVFDTNQTCYWSQLLGLWLVGGKSGDNFILATGVTPSSSEWLTPQNTPFDGTGTDAVPYAFCDVSNRVIAAVNGGADAIMESRDGVYWTADSSVLGGGFAACFAPTSPLFLCLVGGASSSPAIVSSRFYVPAYSNGDPIVPADWRFVVTTLAGETLTFLDRIAENRTITYTLNASATATLDVPSDNPEIYKQIDDEPFVTQGDKLLYGFRREAIITTETPYPWVCRFAGVLSQLNDEITSNTDVPTTHISAFDPLGFLATVPVFNIAQPGDPSTQGQLPGSNGVSYSTLTADQVLIDLLSNMVVGVDNILEAWGADSTTCGPNAFDDLTTPGEGSWASKFAYTNWGQSNPANLIGDPYSSFYTGTIQTANVPININFAQGSSIADAINQLTEAGYIDVIFEPIYDPVNQPGILCQLSIYAWTGTTEPGYPNGYTGAGQYQYNSQFAWDMPGKSLLGVNRMKDGTQLATIGIGYTGSGGAPVAGITGSSATALSCAALNKFGPYFLQTFYTTALATQTVVGLLTIAQIRLQSRGLDTTTIDPAQEFAPRPFRDYYLGDRVPVYASQLFREPISPEMLGALVQATNPGPDVPYTVFVGFNDTFVYDAVTYTVPAGTYTTLAELIAAVQDASTGFSDVATVGYVYSYDAETMIGYDYLTIQSTVWGSNGNTVENGPTNILADLGFTSGQALSGEDWNNFYRVYTIPITIPDDGVETVATLLMTGPADGGVQPVGG